MGFRDTNTPFILTKNYPDRDLDSYLDRETLSHVTLHLDCYLDNFNPDII